MSKTIEPLETNQVVLMWLYAFPIDDLSSNSKKIARFMFALSVITTDVLGMAAGGLFVFKFMSIDLKATSFALFHTIGCFYGLYQSIITVLLRHKLTAIFKNLLKIYNDIKSEEDSYAKLLETNRKCEWMWICFAKYVMVACLINTVAMSVVSIVFLYVVNGHFDADQAYHAFLIILPWNQHTFLGYILELCSIVCIGEAYAITNGAIIVLFISMSLHHRTFSKIFQTEAKKLNFCDKNRNNAMHLRKLIDLHITAKNWFLQSAEAFSPFITVVLISSTLYLSCAMFQLDMQIKHPDFGVATVFIAIPLGSLTLFLYCYFGKMATETYLEMSDCLFECNWLDLSHEHQKYLILMIENMQRPLHYHGFGIVLNLETFNALIRAVASYYMMFKTVAANKII